MYPNDNQGAEVPPGEEAQYAAPPLQAPLRPRCPRHWGLVASPLSGMAEPDAWGGEIMLRTRDPGGGWGRGSF